MSSQNWRVSYNASFTLTFCIISIVFLVVNEITGARLNQMLAVTPALRFSEFYRTITYVFCHANLQHLVGNLLFLLMLGPLLEEKYGTKLLTFMALITAVITALINSVLFDEAIIGASGIVFMCIVLSSIVNIKSKEIPLTFILVVVIYIGREVINSFDDDVISQFGHITGGICGAVLGFVFNRRVEEGSDKRKTNSEVILENKKTDD